MKLIFELSKEHSTIPQSEVVSCLNAEGYKYRIIETNLDVMVVDISCDEDELNNIAFRLSHSFSISRMIFSSTTDLIKVKSLALKNVIDDSGSMAIRCKNRSFLINSKSIVKVLADIYTVNRTVKLQNPEVEVRAIITDTNVYVGVKKITIDRKQFEKRKAQFRPFFSPISLHPKLARALVNLSEIKKGQTLLDPFCGTGGILIEAGLISARIIGSDIDDKLVRGCRENLDFYNIKNYDLFCTDIGNVPECVTKIDAVVTDLPYGKSTTTKGEEIRSLYGRAFDSISKVLKDDGKAVIGIPDKSLLDLRKGLFEIKAIYPVKTHNSLTRYFTVLGN
ncbi:MAG: methyltransferase domain-containing protein [Candidatus Thermoplasmatota archaeon]|nr:methyltransferase domain-containing protein [Candidatus Thermoplasmatota archaeon]